MVRLLAITDELLFIHLIFVVNMPVDHLEPTIYIDKDSSSVGSNGTSSVVSTSTFQSEDIDIDETTCLKAASGDRRGGHPVYLSISNDEQYPCQPVSRCTTASPSPSKYITRQESLKH